jgi:hypothetical protein
LAYSPVNQNLVCFTTYQSVSEDVAEVGKVVRGMPDLFSVALGQEDGDAVEQVVPVLVVVLLKSDC